MAQDFYDRSGRATHYVDDRGTFYTWGGQPVGFVQGEELYTSSGRHVGRISSGWIRDHNGHGVAFSENASGGPLPPLRSLPSLKSLPSLAPLRGLPSLPPLLALPSLSWSQYSVDDLFR
ncbi:4-fold beta flower protein [Bradyrhizobium sp. USDA 223]|uniref:4-fold beta flower protein n=1 Tax=Bradyrhizobium sp. USDA 223 TaxID=3156306 RepID=UPI00383618A2